MCVLGRIKHQEKCEEKNNGEVSSSGRLLLCSILFLCLLEEGLPHGWLLSDVVGSHYTYTNATKQTQTVELLIVLVSLHVATSYPDSNFLFLYIV